MIRPFFNLALFFSLSVFSLPVYAQQSEKIPRIGFLASASRADTSPRVAAFRQALRSVPTPAYRTPAEARMEMPPEALSDFDALSDTQHGKL